MSASVPTQHPAVVLRSNYNHLRSLLAIAMFAIVALSVSVVIVANDDDSAATATPAALSAPALPDGVRFDGGPEEGTRGATAAPPVVRFDGGPEEGTRGIVAQPTSSAGRYDGGPEEGTRGPR